MEDAGRYQVRDIFRMAAGADESDPKQMQLATTGERSAMAGQLRPAEQALVTDRLAGLF